MSWHSRSPWHAWGCILLASTDLALSCHESWQSKMHATLMTQDYFFTEARLSRLHLSHPSCAAQLDSPPPSRRTHQENSLPQPQKCDVHACAQCRMEIITPKDHVGTLMELCQARRGDFVDMQYLTETRTTIIYELPLAQVLPRLACAI